MLHGEREREREREKRKSPHFLSQPVKWILSHILKTNLQPSVTHQRGSGKQTPLLMVGTVEEATVGCLGRGGGA